MSRPAKLQQQQIELTAFEKQLINAYQGGFPLVPEPFKLMAKELGVSSEQVQHAVVNLLQRGVLTRFGPLCNIEYADGAFSLCALKGPAEHFDEITEQVNRYDEVAHNYQREHEWNMWFVLATENQQKLLKVFEEIMRVTQCPGLNLPKQTEFFVGLKLEA